MIRDYAIGFAMVLALSVNGWGCGGLADGEYQDPGAPADAGAEVGSASQPLVTQTSSAAYNQRITGVLYEQQPLNGLTYNYITSSNSPQTWFIPPFRTMTVKVTQNSCTAVQWARFEPIAKASILEIHNALKAYGWSITYSSSGTHNLACLDIPQSVLGANNIRSFTRTQCNTDFANPVTYDTAGAGAFLSGIATRYTNCTLAVDSAAALLAGQSTSQENRIFRHACLHALEKLVGVGEEPDNSAGQGNGTVSQSFIAPSTDLGLFTSGQLCRTRYYQGAADSSPTKLGAKTDKGCANN